ncbi:hypothetical protein HNR42_001566 [Deinobacterium chartae]|uniref:Uncharacterized protein n=1 Tax=Deinobacterium chartae TaxID=521158 RepID=A0A841HX86_9DEIO|nr:hypothetical protein [Deinobacterium chartae]MBB6098141.1 hypothetical protein [Deinobacterium chartae]
MRFAEDPLLRELAQQARELGLSPEEDTWPADAAHALLRSLLEGLVARGLLEGPLEVGCYAARRSAEN